jgi:hypothetical protein
LRPNLGSEAPQRAQSSILEHTLQAVDSENMQFDEQRPDTHGPERRERQQIPNALRYLAPQFLESFKSPRTKQLLDFCSEIRANARQSIKVLCTVHFREFTRKAAYDLGGTPIRTDPKYILGLDGEQIRRFVECGGDLFVMRGNGSTRKGRPPTLCEPHYCHGIPPSCSTTTCGIRERANARSSGQTLHPQSRLGHRELYASSRALAGGEIADMHPSSGTAQRTTGTRRVVAGLTERGARRELARLIRQIDDAIEASVDSAAGATVNTPTARPGANGSGAA